jgi:hypothetical protein
MLPQGELAYDLGILVNHENTRGDGIPGRAAEDLSPCELDTPAIGGVVTGDHVHESRFSGAVLSDDRVDRAGAKARRHIGKRDDAVCGKGLTYGLDAKLHVDAARR